MSDNNMFMTMINSLLGRLSAQGNTANRELMTAIPAMIGLMKSESHPELREKIASTFSELVEDIKTAADPRLRAQLAAMAAKSEAEGKEQDNLHQFLAMMPVILGSLGKLEPQTLNSFSAKVMAILPDIERALREEETKD